MYFRRSTQCLCSRVSRATPDLVLKLPMITLRSASRLYLHVPEEQSKDDDTSKQVEQDKEDRIPLRVIRFWLLIAFRDIHDRRHDINPTFQRDDLKEDQDGFSERVKCPTRLR
jgi:hypothetical protein